jgi:hypothetical protein
MEYHLPEKIEALEVDDDASPLDFLCAVYRSADQPMPRRMRAAEAALQFVHPKLAVAVSLDSEGFATRLEEMMQRRGLSTVIDATSNYTQLKPE